MGYFAEGSATQKYSNCNEALISGRELWVKAMRNLHHPPFSLKNFTAPEATAGVSMSDGIIHLKTIMVATPWAGQRLI